jgi:hypothetical protein
MNHLRRERVHQLGAILACLLGALIGTLFAWIESPLRSVPVHSVSGGSAD